MFRFARTSFAIVVVAVTAGQADTIKICSDKQPIIDYPTVDCGCDTLPGKLPIAIFNFNGQPQLSAITGLDFKFTLADGDTGIGEMDYGKLTLGIGNVNTGLALNGFKAGQENSLEFSWKKGEAGFPEGDKLQQILNDLNADGMLTASILDATPGDNYAQLYSIFETQLCITGLGNDRVPEPSAMLIWSSLAAAALALWRGRR